MWPLQVRSASCDAQGFVEKPVAEGSDLRLPSTVFGAEQEIGEREWRAEALVEGMDQAARSKVIRNQLLRMYLEAFLVPASRQRRSEIRYQSDVRRLTYCLSACQPANSR